MALNAHLGIFQTYATPNARAPDDAELSAISIRGESSVVPQASSKTVTNAAHPPWIKLTGIQYGIRRLDLGGYSQGQGTISHSGIEIEKDRDLASPLMSFHCNQETRFASAKLLILTASSSSATMGVAAAGSTPAETRSIVEVIRLYGVTIESVRANYAGDAEVKEAVTLQYEKIHWIRTSKVKTYSANSSDTSASLDSTESDVSSSHGWDRQLNQPFTP